MHRDLFRPALSDYVTEANPYARLRALSVLARTYSPEALDTLRTMRAEYAIVAARLDVVRTGWHDGTITHERAWPELCTCKDKLLSLRMQVVDVCQESLHTTRAQRMQPALFEAAA